MCCLLVVGIDVCRCVLHVVCWLLFGVAARCGLLYVGVC